MSKRSFVLFGELGVWRSWVWVPFERVEGDETCTLYHCDLDLDWGLDMDVLMLYHASANTTYFLHSSLLCELRQDLFKRVSFSPFRFAYLLWKGRWIISFGRRAENKTLKMPWIPSLSCKHVVVYINDSQTTHHSTCCDVWETW